MIGPTFALHYIEIEFPDGPACVPAEYKEVRMSHYVCRAVPVPREIPGYLLHGSLDGSWAASPIMKDRQ